VLVVVICVEGVQVDLKLSKVSQQRRLLNLAGPNARVQGGANASKASKSGKAASASCYLPSLSSAPPPQHAVASYISTHSVQSRAHRPHAILRPLAAPRSTSVLSSSSSTIHHLVRLRSSAGGRLCSRRRWSSLWPGLVRWRRQARTSSTWKPRSSSSS
jgi:hypothetical protein